MVNTLGYVLSAKTPCLSWSFQFNSDGVAQLNQLANKNIKKTQKKQEKNMTVGISVLWIHLLQVYLKENLNS